MSEIEFDELWQELLSYTSKDFYESVNQIKQYLNGLSDQKHAAFLQELLSVGLEKKLGWNVALYILKSEAMTPHIQIICDRVKFLFKTGEYGAGAESDSESYIVSLLCVLASDTEGRCLALVEEYLLTMEIGPFWTSLPWSLWPHNADLFCRAWVRYFTLHPVKEWRNTAISQAFMYHADALRCLKSQLSQVSEGSWQNLRRDLWSQRNAPWLDDEKRKSLMEVIIS